MTKRIFQLSALVFGLALSGALGCQSSGSGSGGSGFPGCGGSGANSNTSSGPCNPTPNCGSGTHQSGCVCVAN